MNVRASVISTIETGLATITSKVDSTQVLQIVDGAFTLLMHMSVQLPRLQIQFPSCGDSFDKTEMILQTLLDEEENTDHGIVATIVNPGLMKWGDVQGKNLDHHYVPLFPLWSGFKRQEKRTPISAEDLDLGDVIESAKECSNPASRSQSDADSDTVKSLVLRYKRSPRSIILALISVKNDFNNQSITRYSREIDPSGVRTLGLITKPDTLDKGSDSESFYIELAQNREVKFKLDSRWDLRLPEKLEILGAPRATVQEQRRHPLTVSQSFTYLIKAATDGSYSDSFFGDASTDEGYQKRLRVHLQNILTKFADMMRDQGHTYGIVDQGFTKHPHQISREDYIAKVNTLLTRSRGRQLHGTFGPLIIGLFLDSIMSWKRKRNVVCARSRRHWNSFFGDDYTNLGTVKLSVNVDDLAKLLATKTEADMNKYASSTATDFMQAYYKVALKKFIDDFSVLAVETCIVDSLSTLFCPENVLDIKDEMVATLAAEGEESSMERERCCEKLKVLESGRRELKSVQEHPSLHYDCKSKTFDPQKICA
ncbi:dynamin family protein [Paraphaeosphaeria sporulosa]